MVKRALVWKAFPLLMVALAVASVAVAALVLAQKSSPARALGPWIRPPEGQVAAVDFDIAPDLRTVANRATYIIRGTVVKQASTTRDYGLRAPVRKVVSTVRVEESLKGQLGAEHITVGHFGGYEDPAATPGSQVVLFLRQVNHTVARTPVPYDYFTVNGPQGKFLVFQGHISPMGPEYAETTVQYRGMPEQDFVREVRRLAP
ncbi:MAG: hypothetical protein HYY01_07840 [Chloroflexi bacterium]|nr:hypothetical protein [Chloroflexota bacterium]